MCALVQHGGPSVLNTMVSFGAVEAIVEGLRHNQHAEKLQLAGVIALKTFASCPWEIAHRRIAKSGAFGLVGSFMSQALDKDNTHLADEMLEFFYIIDSHQAQGPFGGCPATITHIFTDGAIVPMMRRLHRFQVRGCQPLRASGTGTALKESRGRSLARLSSAHVPGTVPTDRRSVARRGK